MNRKLKVVVADSHHTSGMLCIDYLLKHNIDVIQTNSLSELNTLLSSSFIDILLFDLHQRDGDGMSFIQNMGFQKTMGVIVFTSEYELIDKLITLETCADDFISKPCNFREVVARIHAVHRRIQWAQEKNNTKFYCNDFVVDYLSRTVTLNSGIKLNLTKYEFDVLSKLITNKNRPISRQVLMDVISGYTRESTFRSIDSVIYRLRNKFSAGIPIKTVYGVGYVFEEVTSHISPSLEIKPFNHFIHNRAATKASMWKLALNQAVQVAILSR